MNGSIVWDEPSIARDRKGIYPAGKDSKIITVFSLKTVLFASTAAGSENGE
jgi:hypothetical protein